MNNLKKQFLQYLRSYYGAPMMQGQDGSLPPLKVSNEYPAFQKSDDPMAMLGQLGGMGGMGMMGPMQGQPRQALGGPRSEVSAAQDVLLGR